MSCEVVRILPSGWTRVCVGIVAVALSAVVLGGCASRPAPQAQANVQAQRQANVQASLQTKLQAIVQGKTQGNTQAKYVKRKPASRMLAMRARIPLPDRTLLARQPEPDCTFRGTISSPMTVEELRQKLDYEQQCYRQSESNVRVRLHDLQHAVEETIKAVEER